jgi:hypothetical protein
LGMVLSLDNDRKMELAGTVLPVSTFITFFPVTVDNCFDNSSCRSIILISFIVAMENLAGNVKEPVPYTTDTGFGIRPGV